MSNTTSPGISQAALIQLQDSFRRRATLPAELNTSLAALLLDAEYREWLSDESMLGAPFVVPDSGYLDTLISCGLATADHHLTVKVHSIGGKHFITDGAWVPKDVRVYPYVDECMRLMEYATAVGQLDWADNLIDPACGCGHHCIVAKGDLNRAGFDINRRAVVFAEVNQAINGQRYPVGVRDIGNGLPGDAVPVGNTLILANMPFGLSPLAHGLPLTSDGGRTGIKLTLTLLRTIEEYRNGSGNPVRASVLAYSVGNPDSDRWEVLEAARTLFGSDVSFRLLPHEKMWRINGRKDQCNPMEVRRHLPLKSQCRWDVVESQREEMRLGYERLAEALYEEGYSHVGYGILDIDLCAK